MSLRGVHILFITLSVLLAFGFAFFEANVYLQGKAVADLAASVVGALVGVALFAYGVWYVVKTRRSAI